MQDKFNHCVHFFAINETFLEQLLLQLVIMAIMERNMKNDLLQHDTTAAATATTIKVASNNK
jgi:hypothetical protein